MTEETPQPQSHRAAPLALWRIAREFLVMLYVLFGAPEDIAAKGTLARKTRAQVLSWLRAGEALIRKLLLIEAFALELPTPPPTLSRAPGRRDDKPLRARFAAPFDPSLPTQWRVTFQCLPPQRGGERRAARGGPVTPAGCAHRWDAQPLARRFEALLRAFNDPAPWAARLARRLLVTPDRVRPILEHDPDAPKLVGHEGFSQVADAADEAYRRRPQRESG